MRLADVRHTAHRLPLRHGVHRVEWSHPWPHSSRLDAPCPRAGTPVGRPDRAASVRTAPRVCGTRRCGVSCTDAPPTLPPQDAARRRPAQPFVYPVQFRQQPDVRRRVARGNLVPPVRLPLHLPAVQIAPDQSRQLRRAQPRHLLFLPLKLLRYQQPLDPGLAFPLALPRQTRSRGWSPETPGSSLGLDSRHSPCVLAYASMPTPPSPLSCSPCIGQFCICPSCFEMLFLKIVCASNCVNDQLRQERG